MQTDIDRLTEIVNETCKLHDQIQAQRAQHREASGDTFVSGEKVDVVRKDKKPLRDYLDTLTDDEVFDLQHLMYLGRDGETGAPFRQDKRTTISMITEKSPLSDYLRAGLARLR